MNTFGIDLHRMNKTPPPQIFPPSRGDQHNQATSQRQYHNLFSEQVVSPWQQDHCLNDHSDGNASFISGFWLTGTTGSDCIDPRLMQSGSSPENSYQIPFTGMALVASPDGLAAAASSTTLFRYKSDLAAQDGVYTTHPNGGYFTHTPNYSQHPVRPEQQPASGLQEEEPYADLNVGSLVSSLPPPLHQRTHHQMNKTPPPQTFSTSRGDRHNQATSQRQYHNPFSELVASPWQQDHYLNDHSDGNAGCISGLGLMPNTPPDDGSSPSSLGRSSQYSTTGSYSSSNTTYSQGSGSIDPRPMPSGSSPENPCQGPLTGMPLVASPEELAAAASSHTPFDQSGPATRAAVYTTHPTDGYFGYNPNYSQSLVRQEQQLANGLQDQESYPNLNTGSLVPALPPPLPSPPPYQPMHYGEEGGAVADHPNPSLHKCHCGAAFGRRSDFERHQRTIRKHSGDQHGLVCQVKGCRFTSKFTRDENFRTHCRRQHGMSVDEVNTYIREWKDQRRT